MPVTENFINKAIEAGQLIVEDDVLDDEPDSPTEGRYFATFRAAEPREY